MVWITRYANADQIGAYINHQVFCGAVRSVSVGLQYWNGCGPGGLLLLPLEYCAFRTMQVTSIYSEMTLTHSTR